MINYNFIRKVKDYMLPRPDFNQIDHGRVEKLSELEVISVDTGVWSIIDWIT